MKKQKAHTQKNTHLKNAQANAASNFFKKVFFSPTLQCFNFLQPLNVHTTDKHLVRAIQETDCTTTQTKKHEPVTRVWQKWWFNTQNQHFW
jgi:hypothetical protein